MTLTQCCALVQHQYALPAVCMAFVKHQISVPVILDGRAMIATLASICLAVCMEAVKVKGWAVPALIQNNGLVDCVTFLFATDAFMASVLPPVNVNATQDGKDPTVMSVNHWQDATQSVGIV